MGLEQLVGALEEHVMPEVTDMTLLVVAGVSLVAAVVGLIVWMKDRVSLLMLLIGPLLGLLIWSTLGWDDPKTLGTLMAASLGIGMVTYWILRWKRLRFSQATALAMGGAAPAITFWLLVAADLTRERGAWVLLILPTGLLVCIMIAAVLAAGRRAVAADAAQKAKAGPRAGAETRLVLEMLQQDKITAAEASELFEAIRPGVPADRLPLTGSVVASLLGGLEIVIGWMLPWTYRYVPVSVYLPMAAQEGDGGYVRHHVAGFNVMQGWLLLMLGVVPVLLACMPVLDRYLRQGMLRLFLALIGAALTVSLMTLATHNGGPAVGLILCLIGFGTQLIGALKESGIVRISQGGVDE